MWPSKCSRISLLATFSLLAVVLLPGCLIDEPLKDHVKIALEPSFAREWPVELLRVEPKWIKTGEGRLEGKTFVSLRLKENCYLWASLDEELAALKIDSAETSLLRHALSQAEMQVEPLRSSLLEKAPKQPLEKQPFIKLSEKSGDTLSAEVSLLAVKTADGWSLEIQNISMSRPLTGRTRSAMLAKALVVSSPEAEKLVKEGIEATRQYAALVEKSIEDTVKAQAEAKIQKRKVLLDALEPGSIFMGTLEDTQKNLVTETGLAVETLETGTGLVKGFMFFSADPRRKHSFTGAVREADKPVMLNISTNNNQDAVAELDLQDGRLVGTIIHLTGENERGVISWASADQAALEAKIAAAVAMEAEHTKQLEVYQAALARAIAVGSAFQGVWTYDNRRGGLGLAIESIGGNGLSCAGYLFDPHDRFKRKPFTGIINRDHEAQNALVLRPTRGQGLADSPDLTNTQRSWLKSDTQYIVRLKLKDNGWTGQTNTNYALDLAPVPNFAELLAQDQEAEKKRQEAVQEVVRPGTEYAGTWQEGNITREIGLKMLTLGSSGLVFTAAMFDPAEPDVAWAYNGSISGEGDETRFTLVPAGSDLSGKFTRQQHSTQHMLNDHRYSSNTVSLALTAEGVSGKQGDMTLVFKKIEAAIPVAPAAASPEPAATAYPPLAAVDGKPKAAAHRVRLENGQVELALQVLAPGKTIEAVRIDNIGGVSCLWRSDGQDQAAPLSVSRAGQSLSDGTQGLSFNAGDAEVLLSLFLKDNGAFAGNATNFRVTIFFAGGERAMCSLKIQ